MKAKPIVLVLIFMMTVVSCLFKVNAATVSVPDGGDLIIIQQYPINPEGNPRGPVFNPFTAYRINTTVVLASDTSYGLVNVTLISTAGDYYTTVFDTEDGFIVIPISGNPGDYTLLLADSNGKAFVGYFEI